MTDRVRSAARRRTARIVAAHKHDRAQPCWRCGMLIDYDAQIPSPDAYTLGHRIPVAVAPELVAEESNLAPEHFICNSAARADTAGPDIGTTSRNW